MLQPFSLLPPSLLLLLATAATDAQAFSFPLPLSSSPKPRFKENALSAAGGLGLDHLDGRVAALGDWNGDQLCVPSSLRRHEALLLTLRPIPLGRRLRSVDVFALSGDQRTVDVWLWDHRTRPPSPGSPWRPHRRADPSSAPPSRTVTYAYRKSPVSLLKQHKIHNVVPMDLNHDGRLDLLVMSEAEDGTWWTETSELLLDVHFQGQDGAFGEHPNLDGGKARRPSLTLGALTILGPTPSCRERRRLAAQVRARPAHDRGHQRRHAARLARTGLRERRQVDEPQVVAQLGRVFQPVSCAAPRRTTRPRSERSPFPAFRPRCSSDSPLDPSKTCKLAGPHSSAFIDLDGDCLAGEPIQRRCTRAASRAAADPSPPRADIFLHCEDPYTGENTYQIWLNRQGSFELTRDGRFPAGSGMVTFADMSACLRASVLSGS